MDSGILQPLQPGFGSMLGNIWEPSFDKWLYVALDGMNQDISGLSLNINIRNFRNFGRDWKWLLSFSNGSGADTCWLICFQHLRLKFASLSEPLKQFAVGFKGAKRLGTSARRWNMIPRYAGNWSIFWVNPWSTGHVTMVCFPMRSNLWHLYTDPPGEKKISTQPLYPPLVHAAVQLLSWTSCIEVQSAPESAESWFCSQDLHPRPNMRVYVPCLIG